MRTSLNRGPAPVCHLCYFISGKRSTSGRYLSRFANSFQNGQFTSSRRGFSQKPRTIADNSPSAAKRRSFASQSQVSELNNDSATATRSRIEKDLRDVITQRDKLLAETTVPSEAEVGKVLASCDVIADLLVNPVDERPSRKDDSTAAALLSIDEPTITISAQNNRKPSPIVQAAMSRLSDVAFSILAHPPVFITPKLLRQYVDLQALLKKPETFPTVFNLYATKPVPQEGSSPVKYSKPNPNKVSNAVDSAVADRALQTAIDAKKLVLAMDIVDTTYTTKAYHRAKFVRKGLLPASVLGIAPVAAYVTASQFSHYQTSMDPTMATNIAFVGMLAYIGFTATIGIVAVTTANDQMDRITWALGMPLRERWTREEERAAIDKIAGAWGFREVWRRGEEEGEEWDTLREWVGRKGMVLDRVELMEGME